MEEEVKHMTDDEIVMSEQEESNHGYTQNIQHFEEKDDVDEWLNAEITKHMSMQGVENMKDALISIIKSIRQEMKDDIIKKQFKAPTTSVSDEVSSISSNKVERVDDNTPNTAPCRLPKELSPRSFLLPFNINSRNIYATTTLDAKDNIMRQRVYEHLSLDKLRNTSTLENMTVTNEPLGTVNILVKFGELEFPCNFVIKIAKDVIILERPFLKSTSAQIDVFNEEISFEIGSKKFKFNIDSYQSIEKIYMDEIVEPISFSPDRRGLVKRWHVCKPIHVTYDDGNGEDYGMWPTYDPDLKFCFGYNEVLVSIDDTTRERRIGHNNLHESNHEFIFNERILDSYDVNEEYAKEIGNPYSRRFDEYNRVFNNEIEHLSNKYILRIGKKGYVLDDVWEKCQQSYKKPNEAWHDEGYEEDEMWRSGDEKTDYDPPYVKVKTFEVKKYSIKGGRSFICITDREDEALPLERVNGA
ncbi:phospholipase-like protein [Tanacetum coccineum]